MTAVLPESTPESTDRAVPALAPHTLKRLLYGEVGEADLALLEELATAAGAHALDLVAATGEPGRTGPALAPALPFTDGPRTPTGSSGPGVERFGNLTCLPLDTRPRHLRGVKIA